MLEQRDLNALKDMMEAVVKKSEASLAEMFTEKMDAAIKKSEESLTETLTEKMDAAIRKSEESLTGTLTEKMDAAIRRSEDSLTERMDVAIKKSESTVLSKVEKMIKKSEISICNKMDRKMDKKIVKSEGFLLDEIERVRNILEKEMKEMRKDIDEMKQIYRFVKVETENTTMILKMYNNLEKRVERLEEVTA